MWDLISNIILGISIVTLGVFAILGLCQWVKHKDFAKIDPEIAWMSVPVVLIAITYLIFDHVFILATRPNGSGEPSFPSTHVMVVATIFFIATIILPRYIKDKTTRIILEFLMIVAISLTCAGRILSNMHSIGDCLGGLAFAFAFSEIYYQIIKRSKKNGKKHLRQNYR